MKHSKHSKGFGGNNNENNGDYIFNLYTEFESNNEQVTDLNVASSSRKKGKKNNSDVILSSTPKGKKVYNVIAKILFIISILGLGALIGYAAYEGYLGMPLVFIPVVLFGILFGIHLGLLSKKKKAFYFKRTVSLILSILTVVGSLYACSLMGIVNGFISDITIGGEKNENQVDDITKHPFVVYLSGLDTRNTDEIAEKGLSDVNMVIAVNPQQKKVLMVSTPRDYYVALYGDFNKMDKLTHAGSKGIECSIETLENLYDVKFNYYAKINFKSVYDIVNAVGGVTVYSDFNFSSYYSFTKKTYTFQKGANELTGDSALAFARERKKLPAGDRQRGIHQQKVIKAVIEKAISPSMFIPANIEKMLKAISTNTKTNFNESEIKKLIQYQMKSMSKTWSFESMSVDGTGAMMPTYSYPSQNLYVMKPDEETVENAKTAIKAVLDGKEIPAEVLDNTSSN